MNVLTEVKIQIWEPRKLAQNVLFVRGFIYICIFVTCRNSVQSFLIISSTCINYRFLGKITEKYH